MCRSICLTKAGLRVRATRLLVADDAIRKAL
jgi:hypothetical protein